MSRICMCVVYNYMHVCGISVCACVYVHQLMLNEILLTKQISLFHSF